MFRGGVFCFVLNLWERGKAGNGGSLPKAQQTAPAARRGAGAWLLQGADESVPAGVHASAKAFCMACSSWSWSKGLKTNPFAPSASASLIVSS